MKLLAITLNTFREAVRNKILYSVVLFAVILVAISAFFGTVTVGDRVKVIKDFGLFSLSFFGAVITIIAGTSLLNKELKQKTVYNILSKPVKRWQFIVGKYFGLTLTVSVLVSTMGLGLVAFNYCFEGKIDWLLFQGIFFVLLEVAVMAAVSMFFSALVVTTTLSGIFTLGVYISGRSINHLQYFLEHGEEKNEALADVVRMFDVVVPDLSLFSMNDMLVYGTKVSAATAGYAMTYCVGYCVVALTLATLLFLKRELT